MKRRPEIFRNLGGGIPFSVGALQALRYALRKRPGHPSSSPPSRKPNDGSSLTEPGPHFTWVGHATFVVKLNETTLLTDPVWSERLAYVRRVVKPGVDMGVIPSVDAVTVSHNHYDHMDLPTLRALQDRFDPVFVVPRCNGDLLTRKGIKNVQELDLWSSTTIGDVTVTLVPARHWSRRTLLDTNRRLWGGFVYQSSDVTAYHAGDTAFCEDTFSSIAERFPAIDWAMIPIGAYHPEWFLKDQHVNPEEAGRAFAILGARNFLAMHYGTFNLTDEPLDEPPQRIQAWFQDSSLDDRALHLPAIGETVFSRS